jgi:hypothetical protein
LVNLLFIGNELTLTGKTVFIDAAHEMAL